MRRHITGIDARLSHKFQNMRELRCRLEHTTETYLTGEQEFPTTLLGGKAGAPAAEGKKDPSMA